MLQILPFGIFICLVILLVNLVLFVQLGKRNKAAFKDPYVLFSFVTILLVVLLSLSVSLLLIAEHVIYGDIAFYGSLLFAWLLAFLSIASAFRNSHYKDTFRVALYVFCMLLSWAFIVIACFFI